VYNALALLFRIKYNLNNKILFALIMKMRSSSKKLLLWLYSSGESFRRIDHSQLRYLLPKISLEGKRSLIYYLQTKKMLSLEKFGDKKFLSLTSFGKDFIETNFFFLNQERKKWTGNWIMIVIASKGREKANFRVLRSFLMKNGCISFERGIYLYPGNFDYSIKSYLQINFSDSVVVVNLKEWLYGDHRMIIMNRFQLMELANQYSDISKEIVKLLRKNKNKKELSDRDNIEIFSLYERLFPLFVEDMGLLNYYFSNSVSGEKILVSVQNLVF
jgi:hypothetical protein